MEGLLKRVKGIKMEAQGDEGNKWRQLRKKTSQVGFLYREGERRKQLLVRILKVVSTAFTQMKFLD